MRKRKTLLVENVFVPGGMPEYTYNPRKELLIEEKLQRLSKRSTKIISVTGMTKSGKTVLVNRILPRNGVVWFDGGTFSSETEFWEDICDQTDSFTELAVGKTFTSGITGEIESGVGIGLIASIRAKIGSLFQRTDSKQQRRVLPSKSAALTGLRKKHLPLVIDDFHYISRTDQKSILRALKPLVFEGLVVVIISIPHRKFDVLKSERELVGRVEQIEIPPWKDIELVDIPQKGFPLLNAQVIDDDLELLVKEALGSPHLMQDFCLALCRIHGLNETLSQTQSLKNTRIQIEEVFRTVA